MIKNIFKHNISTSQPPQNSKMNKYAYTMYYNINIYVPYTNVCNTLSKISSLTFYHNINI